MEDGLARRSLRFCRYADDCYVRSRRAGERVMGSVSRFLTKKLLLKGNEAQSAVTRPEERKFLGFSISNDGSERRIAPKALDKLKALIRDMTCRTPGNQSAAADQGAEAIPHRMARLLWLLPDPKRAAAAGLAGHCRAT